MADNSKLPTVSLFLEWNDGLAQYVYSIRRDNKTIAYRKDKEWALRMAAHYGIEVPEEPVNVPLEHYLKENK